MKDWGANVSGKRGESLQMNSEKRKDKRFESESKLIIENLDSGPSIGGQMLNYSDSGLYFESDFLVTPGAIIHIGLLNSPYSQCPNTYECHRVKVKWCRELHRSGHKYGYGVEHLDPVSEVDTSPPAGWVSVQTSEEDSPGKAAERRKHVRKAFIAKVHFICNEQRHSGVVENISRGGVFIRTQGEMRMGESINLAIPGTKYDNGMMIRARIVRKDNDGIGVKISGILKVQDHQREAFHAGRDSAGV